jgi:hypothetical protein
MRQLRPATSPRFPRKTVRVACQVVRERDFRLVADRLLDLSETGALVAPAEPVITGERVLLSFRLPISGAYFDAEATVARVVHARRAGEHARELGLALTELFLDPYTLFAELARLPPIPPRGRPGRRSTDSLIRYLVQRCGGVAKPRIITPLRLPRVQRPAELVTT